MCTVVVRWQPREPTQLLALRDELTDRPFDDPHQWWPEHPGVVGGRDRVAGGTWCASRVATGSTALVLNRPDKRMAEPGAPSRGELPLLAVAHDQAWPSSIDLTGMASFAVVLATPEQLTTWFFDGERLQQAPLHAGTHMVTSGGAEDGKADRYLAAFEQAAFPDGWRELVRTNAPHDEPTALVVRHDFSDRTYATVFGQLLEAEPGRLRLEHSRTPWLDDTWTSAVY